MSEGDDFERLLQNAGSMKASVDNDSIENNFDRGSEGSRDINMIGDNYENQYQKMHSLSLSKEFSKVDNKQERFQKGSLEDRLLNSQAFEDYDEALTELTTSMGYYSNTRLINMMNIILNERKNESHELIELSRNCIFLKQLSLKLKDIENIESYRDVIGQILIEKQRIYSYNFQEESIQLMNLYLEEQNLQLNTINEFINEYFDTQMKVSITHPLNYFYRYVHKMFMLSCFRQSRPILNLFLIAQANPIDYHDYVKQYQHLVAIRKNGFLQLDRKDMEQYFELLMEICKEEYEMVDKYIFPSINWLLTESQQIEKRLQGFRVVNQLIQQAKTKDTVKYALVNWLTENRIIDIFLKDSTHSRILQQIQPIIHFLYETGVLPDDEIVQLMKNSLHSQELFKVAQSMLGWLKLKHLLLVFEIIPYHTDKESTLFISFISSILSNPIVSSEDNSSRKRKTLIIQDNRRQVEADTEMDIEQYTQPTQQFIKKLMHLLVQLVVQYQNCYMSILLKLITAHSRMFKDELEFQIIKLFRNGSVCSLWIVEHWLKIETARDRGQGKYQLITKLASEGVFELILALMTRNRFSRPVVEKALSVIIMFCRFNRPLQKNITEFLWKVLGTTGRDEKEREQFFVFLKEVVRYEGSITEESVNFIFFDILMSLVAGWFSLRVYDCLEMLFLRLNEDCKLISFERDHYKIIKDQLIGTDKLMYIYFNCMDLKVVKKCRDFICKLVVNAEETKQAMYMYIINNLKKYMTYTFQMNKPDQANKKQVTILRIFELAQKLYLEKEKIQESKESTINLHITVTNMQFFGARNSNMEFNEKITLSDLRCYIGDNLNPPTKQIQLWTAGKLLKGQNLTLKELKLENNQTISVTNADSIDVEEDKSQKKQQQLQTLTAIIGQQADPELLQFIINKFEGQSIETIVNDVLDPDRMKMLQNQFKDSKFQKEEIIIEVENPKQKAKNFGTLLVHHRDILQMMLECLKISQNKVSGWNFIKKLPLNQAYVAQVNELMQKGQWEKLFKDRVTQHAIYIVHIISNYLKQNPNEVQNIFQQKNLRKYIIEWLSTIIMKTPDEMSNYEDLFKLLLVQTDCPVITLLDEFLHNKAMSQKDFQIIPLFENSLQSVNRWSFGLSQMVASRMIDSLLLYPMNERMATLIAKIYILQLIYPANGQKYYSLLTYNKLEALLLKYGRPLQFIVVATALHFRSQDNDYFLLKFTFKLLSSYREDIHNKHHTAAYSSFFSCLNALITISSVNDSGEELIILTDLLYQVKNQIQKLEQEEVIGYFKLAVTLLDRHFKVDKGGERKNEDMHVIATWLFNEYLFGRNNQYPYYTSKHLRKAAYLLLLKMCAYHDILRMVTHSIRHIMKGFKDTNQVQGQFRNTEFIGIRNLGATCYINSLIQQLYHTSFPTILLADDNESSDNIKLLELKKIFANLYCGIRSPVYPNEYVDTVKINGELVRPMVQQDANQFFASLMHDVQQTVGSKAQNQTICGSLTHQIRGLQEGSEVKNVEETFLTMMIDIKYKKNLLEGLSSLSKPHVLEGQNMYYSEVLHKKIRASSKTYLGKLPNILVITLKRFYWNFQQMNRIKINDYFQFPMELELNRFAMQGRKQSDPHYFDYKLCGILIHSGSAESGHYYSFIKVGDRWLQFNDRKVSEWDIHNNLRSQCFGGNEEKSKNAYMLFYERVDSQAHGCLLNKLPQNNKLLELVRKENQNFVLNRLVYDSNYIDFIKDLSRFENNGNIITILDSLKYYRQTPEVYFQRPEEKAEEANTEEQKKVAIELVQEAMVDQEESAPLLNGPPKVTSKELKQLAERHYPGGMKDAGQLMYEEETPHFN